MIGSSSVLIEEGTYAMCLTSRAEALLLLLLSPHYYQASASHVNVHLIRHCSLSIAPAGILLAGQVHCLL